MQEGKILGQLVGEAEKRLDELLISHTTVFSRNGDRAHINLLTEEVPKLREKFPFEKLLVQEGDPKEVVVYRGEALNEALNPGLEILFSMKQGIRETSFVFRIKKEGSDDKKKKS